MGGDRLPEFLETGIYRFESSNTVFIDPVRVLNRYYTRFRVSPSTYYTRSFTSKASSNPKKRRRNQKQKPRVLNERELASDQRHQLVRPMLMKSHECLMGAADLLEVMRGLNVSSVKDGDLKSGSGDDISFVELGQVWQAPLYEVTVNLREDPLVEQSERQRVVPLFNSLVVNNTCVDAEAEILHRKYVMPRNSCFFMSDLAEIHNLVPAGSDSGFNLIVLDPPWENASAQQKLLYPTLPNRYFLSVPIKQLTHKDGALVALWVTNREKLRDFVERELFPAWGVSYAASLYWLKVKEDGSLISDLDLFHHRPYECLMLGYSYSEDRDPGKRAFGKSIIDIQTIISIPGDYSRKPPIGELLMGDAPGCKPARCIELFAREMMAGWTSWGNEPLHFQDSSYFLKK